jgi:hypothetical protein
MPAASHRGLAPLSSQADHTYKAFPGPDPDVMLAAAHLAVLTDELAGASSST